MSWLPKWWGRGAKEDALLTLKLRLARWRHLLRAEESFLHLLGDMRERLSGEYVLDRQYILSSVGQVFQHSYQVAYDMGILCDLEGVPMYPWLDRRKEETMAYLRNWPLVGEGPPVIPLPAKGYWRADQVGEMASHLLEIGRAGWAEFPRGFIIPIGSFLRVIRHNHLERYLQPEPGLKKTDWAERYRALAGALLQATIPEDLKSAVGEALRSLGADPKPSPPFRIWPSPLRSGILPVFPFPSWRWDGHPPESFWDGLRSLWSRVYSLGKPTGEYPVLSAVVCQRQISGEKMYRVQTVDPEYPGGREILVSPSIPPAPSGEKGEKKFPPFRFSRNPSSGGLDPGPGEDYPKEKKLAFLSLRVENHFKRALEILWEEDGAGVFHLIQLRPQDLSFPLPSAHGEGGPYSKEWQRHYVRQGQVVSRGISSGPAFHPAPGQDPAAFPEGGILVATGWRPEWKALLPKISALLLEHPLPPPLALWVRSYRVPAICRLPGIGEKFSDRTVLTVDGEDNIIYEGRVEPLLYAQLLDGPRLEEEPEYLLLEGILRAMDPAYTWEEEDRSPSGKELGGRRTLVEGIQWARGQVMALFSQTSTWRRLVQDRMDLPVPGGRTLPIFAADLDRELAAAQPWADPRTAPDHPGVHSTPWSPIWHGLENMPFLKKAFTQPGEEFPLFLVKGENSLFLSRCSSGNGMIADCVVTGIPELDHLFVYWEGEETGAPCGYPEEPCEPGREGKRPGHELRAFGKSVAEMKEELAREA